MLVTDRVDLSPDVGDTITTRLTHH